MNCPYCKEETGPGESCSRCGKTVITSKSVKVEYKDFKGSELLDIQMTRGSQPGQPIAKPGPEQVKVTGPKKAEPAPKKTGGSNPFLFIAVVIVVLAAIAGFYLLRFLGLLN